MEELIVTFVFAVPTIVLIVMCNRKRNEMIDVGIRCAESLDGLFRVNEELEKSMAEIKARRGGSHET